MDPGGGWGWHAEIKKRKRKQRAGEKTGYIGMRNKGWGSEIWPWNKGRSKMRGEDGWNRGQEETRIARWTNAIHLSSCPAAGEAMQCTWPYTKTQTRTDRKRERFRLSWRWRTLILHCRETEEGRVGKQQALLEGEKTRRRRNKGSSGGEKNAGSIEKKNGEGETEGRNTCVQTWELRRGSAADHRWSQHLCGEIKQFHEAWTANDSSLVSDTGRLN